jgi:hypothetical protein
MVVGIPAHDHQLEGDTAMCGKLELAAVQEWTVDVSKS